ncbi:MAG TPA: thiamine-phosphate kinase [Casimicrobiaceae bacterium]
MSQGSALGEFELIERFFRRPTRSAVLGIGDDAALLQPSVGCEIAISVDMLVSGRHFFADADPRSLGHKTLAVNLSDMAAMGATPRWALLAGALTSADGAWLAAFSRGLFELADALGVELVGGDTTRGPLTLCVTIVGEVPAGQALRRSGARAGDSIWISGRLGSAALALAHLQEQVKLSADEFARCERALLWPIPRVALGLRLRGLATAAIDVSDGLTGDLGHVLRASGVGARVDLAAIAHDPALDLQLHGSQRPVALRCLLAGGDDYELCFTAPKARDSDVAALAAELDVELTRIGEVIAATQLTVLDETGRALSPLPAAFDHFSR